MRLARKISKRRERQLVQIYLHMGQEIAAEMSVEFGMASGYARSRVTELGLLPPRKHRGGGDIAVGVDHSDHRWAWAVSRGSIGI